MKDTNISDLTSACFNSSLEFSDFFRRLVKPNTLTKVYADIRGRYSRDQIVMFLGMTKFYGLK